ncbi:MAG TPA: ABC transporter permease [bacterium]|nr:ABC transporter permease [bacterium]
MFASFSTFPVFPSLLLGLLVVATLGAGLENTIVAVALSLVPQFARLARGATLAVREMAYVEWCNSSGATQTRTLTRHILPNIIGPITVMGTLWVSTAIRTEASLSFLGLGIQPPTPSWGTMIKAGVDQIGLTPWLAISPGLAIMVSVLAFNMVGDGLRDVLDPKSRGR